jgi:hypothetical protein
LPGFQFDSSEQVRAKLLPDGLTVQAMSRQAMPAELPQHGGGVQRLAELPLYASDLLVRQAAALQATRQAKQADQAQLGSALWKQLGLPDGGEGLLRVTQGAQHVTVRVRLNEQTGRRRIASGGRHRRHQCAGGLVRRGATGAGSGAMIDSFNAWGADLLGGGIWLVVWSLIKIVAVLAPLDGLSSPT